MPHTHCRIIRNVSICEGYHELRFEWNARRLGRPLPGQFVTVRVSGTTTPLLRRPLAFSGYDSRAAQAAIVFQKRGPATRLLSAKEAGESLDLIGPLGNAFPTPKGKGSCIVAAGGIGLGPMLFLAQWLRSKGRKALFVYGCARKALVPKGRSFREAKAVVCTDDGSKGYHGTSVDYLRTLPPGEWRDATLYACGPKAMMKACHKLAIERGVPCWVSMEQTMACGVGACMGCVVRVKGGNGFARVCTEGPVFESRMIEWAD